MLIEPDPYNLIEPDPFNLEHGITELGYVVMAELTSLNSEHLCNRSTASNSRSSLGCNMFVMQFIGRDTVEPAHLFAEQVLPHFA